jgi:riboflavin synthase
VFTGIIEALGEIDAVTAGGQSGRVSIRTPEGFGPLTVGESIAVNGACLTAEELLRSGFAASVSPETLSRTTLGRLRRGDKVNLERALAMGARLGGHLVSGHVDAVGHVRSISEKANSWDLAVETPPGILSLSVEKGSIAIDGMSLTIAALESWGVRCAIIPHTFRETNLSHRRAGDKVNIESDMIGKYVQRLLGPHTPGERGITWETLEESGYL